MSDDELIEAMARAIFEHWEFQPVKSPPVAWVPGGNSLKQDTARQYARVALQVVRAHDGDAERLECGHPAACEKSLSGIQADGAEGCADWCEWCAELAAVRAERDDNERGWQRTYDHDVALLKARAEAEAARLRATLEAVASIAHTGGLVGLTTISAMAAVRRLTIEHWQPLQSREEATASVNEALRRSDAPDRR